MGLGIWALAHATSNGYAGDVAFFGGLVVFVLVGSWHQDRRKLAGGDPQFERFHAATAFIPFTSRDALRGLMELPPLAAIIGVVVALVARYLHPSIGGEGGVGGSVVALPVSARARSFERSADMATRIGVLFNSDTPHASCKARLE